MQPHGLPPIHHDHLLGREVGKAVSALVVVGLGQRFRYPIAQQRSLPPKGEQLISQCLAPYGQIIKSHLQGKDSGLKFGEGAVLRCPAHMAQPDVVVSIGTQVATGIRSGLDPGQSLGRGESQIGIALPGKGPAIAKRKSIKGVDREIGVGETKPVILRQGVDRYQRPASNWGDGLPVHQPRPGG